jgi:hypothetical protein
VQSMPRERAPQGSKEGHNASRRAQAWHATRMAHGLAPPDGAQAWPSAQTLAAQAQPETRVTPELSRRSPFGRSLRPAYFDRTPAQGPRPRDWGGFTQGGAVAGGTGQARVSPRRNLAPPHYIGVVGCAERAHSQGPGEPRVRHPKGRTTTRAGRRESGRDAWHEQRHPGGPGPPARPDPARVWAQM